MDTAGQPTGVYQREIFNTKTGRWYECRESEQKYRTLFEETLNPILMVDENKIYIDANKAALEFLECDRKELLGRNAKRNPP
jgi:PAS domain-containing protein